MKELAFLTAGAQPSADGDVVSFLTLSGKTRVTVEIKHVQEGAADVVYDMHSQVPPVLDGVQSFARLRKMLMGRVEAVLAGINAQKRYGSQPPFEVLVEHGAVALSPEGVAASRALIGRLIDALEGR